MDEIDGGMGALGEGDVARGDRIESIMLRADLVDVVLSTAME